MGMGDSTMSRDKEPILDLEAFIEWFKANQPLCGKVKTMERICEAFPESAVMAKRPYPPYDYHHYSSLAAIAMNKLNDAGRMKTYKKGRSYCYEIV